MAILQSTIPKKKIDVQGIINKTVNSTGGQSVVPKPTTTPVPKTVSPVATSPTASSQLAAIRKQAKGVQKQVKDFGTRNAVSKGSVKKPDVQRKASDILRERITESFNPSKSEINLTERLNKTLAGGELGQEKILEQAIPQGLLVGQGAALERQTQGKALPLQRQLALLQQQRTGNREAAQTQLGFEQADQQAAQTQQSQLQGLATQLIGAGATQEQVNQVLQSGDVNIGLQLAAQTGLLRQEEELPTQVISANGRSLLVNTQTGETIKDLGATESAIARATKAAETANAAASGTNVINEFGEFIQATTPPKPATGAEDKAFTFFSRMNSAVQNLDELDEKMANLNIGEQLNLKFGGSLTQGQELERISQAQREFTEARLRKDSGAAIPPEEFENDKETYFPRPGDSAETIAQKKASRAIALAAIRLEAGNAYWEFYGESPTTVGQKLLQNQTTEQQIQTVNGVGEFRDNGDGTFTRVK